MTLAPDDNVTEVFLKTREETANVFPVLEKGILVGMVNRVDLLSLLNILTCHNARRIK
ncbi:CBS domain-containing protein [Psychromonas sp. Urea-02u-13]|uniref:CBS domain-containing protein n=1 Tax=Psychromonas sp. Urea-02u-13 TaxID=2058326 RepID=UPI003FA68FC4